MRQLGRCLCKILHKVIAGYPKPPPCRPHQAQCSVCVRFDLPNTPIHRHTKPDPNSHQSQGVARLAHVSRARITQIMNLLLLAPSIQEALLFLPLVEQGRDQLKLADLQKVTLEVNWGRQKRIFGRITA